MSNFIVTYDHKSNASILNEVEEDVGGALLLLEVEADSLNTTQLEEGLYAHFEEVLVEEEGHIEERLFLGLMSRCIVHSARVLTTRLIDAPLHQKMKVEVDRTEGCEMKVDTILTHKTYSTTQKRISDSCRGLTKVIKSIVTNPM